MKENRDKRPGSIMDWLRGLVSGPPVDRDTMIPCEEALAVLYEYLDNELTGMTHDRVKAHFDVCARCYPRLRLEESFRLAVRRAARGEKAPPLLRDQLLRALSRARTGQ